MLLAALLTLAVSLGTSGAEGWDEGRLGFQALLPTVRPHGRKLPAVRDPSLLDSAGQCFWLLSQELGLERFKEP